MFEMDWCWYFKISAMYMYSQHKYDKYDKHHSFTVIKHSLLPFFKCIWTPPDRKTFNVKEKQKYDKTIFADGICPFIIMSNVNA